MSTELKDCPFCGGSNLYSTGNGIGSEFIECADCGGAGPASDHSGDADDQWNRRAALAASGGNAAPDGAVTGYGTMPELPEHGEMGSMITKGKIHPKYSADQMRAYGKACTQSAPNAALVAALQELALLMSDVIRGEYEPDSFTLQPAVHALAAVGIEFPDDDYLLTKRESCTVVPLHPTSAMLKAMSESRATDDEGEYPSMLDLLDFSGENKTRTALKAAYVAALSAAGQEP
jgi:Lar family restriction alleviation protein